MIETGYAPHMGKSMELDLGGKVAIVTGGSKGLGAASARLLAGEGARLVLMALGADRLEAVGQEARDRYGTDVVTCPADLIEVDAAEGVVAAAMNAFGRIDILINAAGSSEGGVFWDIPDRVWADSMALKFHGTVRIIRAVVPRMMDQAYGRIVTIVGNTGRQPNPRMLPGAAANAGLLAVTKGLAEEPAPHGVIVNAVNPGPTRTERWRTLMSNMATASGRKPEEVEGEIMKDIPMGRLGEPDEIARLVVFLASDAAANMTGTSLTADGGWTKALA
jgi:NAD(P)-dependent dehydrogenase (short-subunit alcohol dehydrogenase family)